MRDTFDDSDILRLLEGDCAPDEAAALQSWIIADPKRVALLDQLQVVWRLTGATTRDWELRAAGKQLRRARFLRAIRSAIPPPWAWIAATVVLVSASAVLWRRPPHAAPFREYATAPGQRSQLTLIDGTLVLLMGATRVERIAKQIRQGKWKYNGDTIKIAATGDVLDGQHRLWAIIESKTAVETVIVYGTSVTDADIIMSDGVSLEGVGVTPNLPLLPAAADLRARRDLAPT